MTIPTRAEQYAEAKALRDAASAMLAALKHARTVLMTSADNRNRASENIVWIEVIDAIAAAEAAGIKEAT